jgi:hypothetical protein
MLPAAKFILEEVIQRQSWISVIGQNVTSFDGVRQSLVNDSGRWLVYVTGFIVVGGLGLLAALFLVVAGPAWVVITRCGRLRSYKITPSADIPGEL